MGVVGGRKWANCDVELCRSSQEVAALTQPPQYRVPVACDFLHLTLDIYSLWVSISLTLLGLCNQ